MIWAGLSALSLQGQTVSIKVVSEETGEGLYHAHAINLRSAEGNSADETGRIQLPALAGDSVRITYVGYQDTIFQVTEEKIRYEIRLHSHSFEEVVILAEEPFNRRAAEGHQDVPMEFLKALPAFNGDPDIMKAITFLPGVSGGKEGYSHLSVRGGGVDENLVLLDGAPLYNVNHFGGFISMFHSEMIRNVDFYKGYWPARFGGRLSSVMDIKSGSGNYKEHIFSADISPLSVKTHLSGPLWKDKVSYIIGGRRSFIDLLLLRHLAKPIREGKRKGSAVLMTVFDFNGKVEARISDKQTLSFSTFRGTDRFFHFENDPTSKVSEEYNIRNQTFAINYNHYTTSSTTLKAHLSTSYYHHFNEDEFDDEKASFLRSGNMIRTYRGQVYGETYLSNRWQFNYGLDREIIAHDIYLNRSNTNRNTGEILDSLSISSKAQAAHITSVFADGTYHFSDRFRLKTGFRLPRYQYDNYRVWMYEPRLLLSFDLNRQTTINTSYNRQEQYSHQLGFTESLGRYREFYMVSDEDIDPSLSHQWSTGIFYHFTDTDSWLKDANLSVEGFYKKQTRLNKFLPRTDPDRSVVEYKGHLHQYGTAKTYGMEFLFQKTAGKFHGSLAYAFARSRTRFSRINYGRPFDADFDARHNVNLLLIYKFRKGYKLSGQWDYNSGRPFTLPVSRSDRDVVIGSYPLVNAVNEMRFPAYHRLDLSLDREWRTRRKGIKNWFGVSVYNVYNRVNPYFASPGYDEGQLQVVGMFPIFPSFHYGFELGGKKKKK